MLLLVGPEAGEGCDAGLFALGVLSGPAALASTLKTLPGPLQRRALSAAPFSIQRVPSTYALKALGTVQQGMSVWRGARLAPAMNGTRARASRATGRRCQASTGLAVHSCRRRARPSLSRPTLIRPRSPTSGSATQGTRRSARGWARTCLRTTSSSSSSSRRARPPLLLPPGPASRACQLPHLLCRPQGAPARLPSTCPLPSPSFLPALHHATRRAACSVAHGDAGHALAGHGSCAGPHCQACFGGRSVAAGATELCPRVTPSGRGARRCSGRTTRTW